MFLTRLFFPLVLLLCGCAETRVLMRGSLERESSPWMLRFEGAGRAFVGTQRIFLATEAEYKHFGITVVDASSLPEEWTHGTAESRAVLVSLIDRSSPLAAAGIRPYDRILELNGEEASLAVFRRHIKTAYSLQIKFQRPSGQIKDCVAVRSENIYQCDSLYLPVVFDFQSTSSGHYLGIGLWQLIYHHRSAMLIPFPDKDYGEKQDDYKDIQEQVKGLQALEREMASLEFESESENKPSALHRRHRRLKKLRKEIAELEDDAEDIYRKRFEWGVLANLIYYQSEVNPVSGRRKRRFRFLWFLSFGAKMTKDL